ncbi:TonB-dependent receptor [Pedobacter deserti]|uniref:TonB-dependent receptor n=1 Tax=Pedobacter deserti TaxID=2817382 RepID=UPI00210C38DA|nr:TonB-dependent receptor [Pedobacter sp. SYSU D00382]
MQISKFLLLGILCTCVFFSQAQTGPSSLKGRLTSSTGEPVPSATIKIQNSTSGAVSDENGYYQISNVVAGSYSILVSAIGFHSEKRNVKIEAGKQLTLNFTLAEDTRNMETVNVIGRTKAQEVNRQAFNVTAVDATKLYNTTLDISGALDRVAGVRVRESGGVGSNFNVSLNGFSGSRIRFFIDGIPMDNFGSSFQINNIPINVAERVEVYKGVVPMWLGSDALGGAINIVTGDRHRNYVDASYSYGSFNTHRSVLNGAVTTKDNFTFQVSAFQNYSDNDYKMDIMASDIFTGQYYPGKTIRRFNDTYHNETVIANIGVVDKSYADKLLLGMTVGKNYKEIQTGARTEAVFGALHRRGNILMPSLKYRKSDLLKGLDVTINANYNLGFEQNIDTVNARFDWYGTRKSMGTSGERGTTLAKYRNHNGLGTAMFNYRLDQHQSIALSNVYNTFNRTANDILNPANSDNGLKRRLDKNVIGLGYSYDVADKWSGTAFGKMIYQKTINGNESSGQPGMTKFGFGTAFTYFFDSNLQLRASYERSNRLPEAQETFGDLENLEGNPDLRPESSDNLNLGMVYGFSLNNRHYFSVTATGIYRYAKDFIFSRLNRNQTRLILDNKQGVSTWGGDAELRYSYGKWLSAGATMTYQFLRNLQKIEPDYNGVSPLYLDQMPNIPYLFGNGDVSITLPNLGGKGTNLNIGYNLLYVHSFWLYWPSLGTNSSTTKNEVPQQFSHDVNLVYSMAKGRYNIGVEARNITDVALYDNFSLQKPSRGFYLNLRYFINRQ